MRWVPLVLGAVVGCGGGGAAEPADSAAPTFDGATADAARPGLALPSIPDHGGPRLTHVELVTITYAGYAYQAEIQAFGDWIVGSPWLHTVAAEYGIGDGAHVAKVVVPTPAPAMVGMPEIEAFLTAGIASHLLPTPSPANDTLYVVYYPATTQVNAPGFHGCETGGFHYHVDTGTVRFAYAPIPDCSATAPAGWTPIESIEENASHEIVEAMTNPFADQPAWWLDDPTDPWSIFYGEVADYCVGGIVHDGAFTATRSWSNAAARTGIHPCQPAPDAPYFNVSTADASPIVIPAGGQASFTITGFASAPRAAWSIYVAAGWITSFDPAPTATANTIGDGQEVTVTVRAPAGVPPKRHGSVIIYSFDDPQVPAAEWPVLVSVQ